MHSTNIHYLNPSNLTGLEKMNILLNDYSMKKLEANK